MSSYEANISSNNPSGSLDHGHVGDIHMTMEYLENLLSMMDRSHSHHIKIEIPINDENDDEDSSIEDDFWIVTRDEIESRIKLLRSYDDDGGLE